MENNEPETQQKNSASCSIAILDVDMIVHPSLLWTLWKLGNSGARRLLKNLGCTRREQNALISEMHKRIGDPTELSFWNRIKEYNQLKHANALEI